MTRRASNHDRYVPPTGDEPLNEIERGLVRLLLPILLAEIREELANEEQDASDTTPDTTEHPPRD